MIRTGHHPLGTVPHESPPSGLAHRLYKLAKLTRIRAALGLPDPMEDKQLVRMVMRRVYGPSECPRCACSIDECDCRMEVRR